MPIYTLRETISQIPNQERVGAPVSTGKMSLVSEKSMDFRMD
jgi:hypothetical protein